MYWQDNTERSSFMMRYRISYGFCQKLLFKVNALQHNNEFWFRTLEQMTRTLFFSLILSAPRVEHFAPPPVGFLTAVF